jgi:hypothetical protein
MVCIFFIFVSSWSLKENDSEFNYVRDASGACVLQLGTEPLPDDDSCRHDEEFWYGRTAYRKIPYSSCEDGFRPDQGPRHRCPGFKGHGIMFWLMVLIAPFGFTSLVAYWYYRRSGLARGCVDSCFIFIVDIDEPPQKQNHPSAGRHKITILCRRQRIHVDGGISTVVSCGFGWHWMGVCIFNLGFAPCGLPVTERLQRPTCGRGCADSSVRRRRRVMIICGY